METINHLLVGCTFAREFWSSFLSQVGLQLISPQPSDTSFYDWWERANNDRNCELQEGLNSLTILGAWTIWTKHSNKFVFDGPQARSTFAEPIHDGFEQLQISGGMKVMEQNRSDC
jgi:hypothetical protein